MIATDITFSLDKLKMSASYMTSFVISNTTHSIASASDHPMVVWIVRTWRGKLVRATYADNHQGNGEVDK